MCATIANVRCTRQLGSPLMDDLTWDLYFCSLAGWTLHPGYKRPGTSSLTIMDCAQLADQMLLERRRRWPDGEQQQQQQQQPSDNGVQTNRTVPKLGATDDSKNECPTQPSRDGWQTSKPAA